MDAEDYQATRSARRTRSRACPICGSRRRTRCAPTPQWLEESEEYIQFVNPGDLRGERRVTRPKCATSAGGDDDRRACCGRRRSTTTAVTPYKNARYGESYAPDGTPQTLPAFPAPTAEETQMKGWLPYLSRCRDGR